jgi:uncharacterized protein (TIGR00725 family)
MAKRIVVAVIGQSSPGSGPEAEAAEAVGAALAQAGATVVTGGMGGVMAAASRGARRAGGTVIGVVPGTDRGQALAEADAVVATGIGEARDLAVVASADAVVAIGGGWGTLAEIGLARKLGRPVVLLRSWSIRGPGGEAPPGCHRVETPEQAAALALEVAR